MPGRRLRRGTRDAMTLINDYAPLLLRICLVMLFPFSGLDKILNWGSAMKQAGGMPVQPRPCWSPRSSSSSSTPVCIVAGWHDRLAAFILAGFCVVTAVLFHQFWRFPDFWRFQEGEGLRALLGVPEEFWPGGRPRPDRAGAANAAGQRGRAASARIHPCRRASGGQPDRARAVTTSNSR